MLTKSKAKAKGIRYFKEKAWKLFSEYVRRFHSDESGFGRCYTCETRAHYKALQCGHAIPGRHTAVLLDAEICRPQCISCNVFRHGQLHIFATKLQLENGEEWWLKKLADSNRSVKISRYEYEEKIQELKSKLALLNLADNARELGLYDG